MLDFRWKRAARSAILFLAVGCSGSPAAPTPAVSPPPAVGPAATARATVASASAEATVKAYIAAAEAKDADRLLAQFAEDAVYYDYAWFDARENGPQPIKNMRLSYVSFFGNPYLHLKYESYFLSADGSSAALIGTYTDFTESGHNATVPLAEILRLRDGKIVRQDEYYDDVGLQ